MKRRTARRTEDHVRWEASDGKLDMDDCPSLEYSKGYRAWYRNGKLHREDGPAVEWWGGYKEWWVDGARMSEDEFRRRRR